MGGVIKMQKKNRTRHIKTPTPDSLKNAALFYLSRYAASENSLRRVLNNRLRRAVMLDAIFASDNEKQNSLRKVIDEIIEHHKKSGGLNDAAFAETKINSLRRAGRSRRSIQQRLSHKGVAAHVITEMLEKSDDGEDPRTTDIKAALYLARKRKLGKFRGEKAPLDRRQKDLATLARAGFSLDIARQVLGEDTSDDDLL